MSDILDLDEDSLVAAIREKEMEEVKKIGGIPDDRIYFEKFEIIKSKLGVTSKEAVTKFGKLAGWDLNYENAIYQRYLRFIKR